jgi:SAM-dependent methyltransferase
MSFWPFPKTLLAELSRGLLRGPGIELGSGAGLLRERLGVAGIPLLSADTSGRCDVRLDATSLPIRSDIIGLLVAGNLLRHLDAQERDELLHEAARVLRVDGRLLLIEDDLDARTPAEANYRTTLELLARADPSRGAALDLGSVVDVRPEALAHVVWRGVLENEERPADAFRPLDWLAAHGGIPRDELELQRARVTEHGMEYGRFQVCLLERASRERG